MRPLSDPPRPLPQKNVLKMRFSQFYISKNAKNNQSPVDLTAVKSWCIMRRVGMALLTPLEVWMIYYDPTER